MGSMRTTLPVHPIDLEPFRTGGPAERREVAQRLDAACRDTGFLRRHRARRAAGHVRRRARRVRRVLRPARATRSARCVVDDPAANRGYSALGQEGLRTAGARRRRPTCSRRSTWAARTPSGEYYERHRSFYAPNMWPTEPGHLRDAWRAYERRRHRGRGHDPRRRWRSRSTCPSQWFVERCEHAIITTRAINYERARRHARSRRRPDAHGRAHRLRRSSPCCSPTTSPASRCSATACGTTCRRRGARSCATSATCSPAGPTTAGPRRCTGSCPRPSGSTGAVRRRSIARFLDCPPDLVVETSRRASTTSIPPRYEPVTPGSGCGEDVGQPRAPAERLRRHRRIGRRRS